MSQAGPAEVHRNDEGTKCLITGHHRSVKPSPAVVRLGCVIIEARVELAERDTRAQQAAVLRCIWAPGPSMFGRRSLPDDEGITHARTKGEFREMAE